MSNLAFDLQIRAILHRYAVRSHWRATTDAQATRYALFCDGVQLGDPGGHRELQQQREDLIVADLKTLMRMT